MASEKDEAEDMATGFLQSQKVDWTANYIARGQKFGAMPQGQVEGEWLASMKAMGDDPFNKANRDWNNDAESELSLRGIEPPIAAGKDDMDRFLAASRKRVEDLMADPVERARVEKLLIKDLKAFGEQSDN
jgi:hypothetical protein